MLPEARNRLAPSEGQKVGAYVAFAIIFGLSLPLIKINPLLFLSYSMSLVVGAVILINDALRGRKGKEMAQK